MAKISPAFSGIKTDEAYETAASYSRITLKTFLLFGIAFISGILSIFYLPSLINPLTYIVFAILAVICVLIGTRSASLAMPCSIIYAVCEGFFLGLITYVADYFYPGIALGAIIITAIIFCIMLILYSTKIIRVTQKFTRIMFNILISLAVLIIGLFITNLIAPNNVVIQLFYGEYSSFAIIFSILLIVYAAFMLTIDFERIVQMVNGGFDKRYEWSAALGLMVTIVWIYIEVLRLLMIIANKRR